MIKPYGIITAIFCMFAMNVACAAPVLNVVTGEAGDNQLVTITGSGFGSGPNVILYDDFEGGAAGQTIDADAVVGKWTNVSTLGIPVYDSDAHSGSLSYMGIGKNPPTQEKFRKLGITFSPVTEFHVSFWVKFPDGYTFPGSSTPRTFPDSSTLKLGWIMDGKDQTRDDDVIIINQPKAGNFYLGGNDTAALQYVGNSWLTTAWNKWIRVTVWMKSNGASQPGEILWEIFHDGVGNYETRYVDSKVVMGVQKYTPAPPHQWSYFVIVGWAGNGDSGWVDKAKMVIDDFYLAVGPNARAKVEIGDAPAYKNCKKLMLLTPTNWTDTQIVARVHSNLVTGSNAFLYVTDANGNVNSIGKSICPKCPNPPKILQVQ